MAKKLYILLPLSIILLLQACSYTRHVPEERLLLWDQNVYVNSSKGAPGEALDILKQHPNSGIWVPTEGFGFYLAPGLAVYNWGNAKEGNVFSKLGDAPVILDTNKIRNSSEQLNQWYFNNGYFNSRSSFSIERIRANSQKAEVNYFLYTGPRYYVNKYSYAISTKGIEQLVAENSSESILAEGQPYDATLLDEERERLSRIFRNNGYFGFNKGLIAYEADTNMAGDSVSVKMIISDEPVERGDSLTYLPHRKHYIKKVVIRPDKSYSQANKLPHDTIGFRDYLIAYDTLRYKPRYLTDAIHFKKGDLYNSQQVRATYSHLVSYGAFQLSEINFDPVPGDSNLLIAVVNLSPLDKRTFTLEPEITSTSGNIGFRAGLGYTNRNLFKAGEKLQIKVNAGLEWQPTAASERQFSQTWEVGSEASISFPRFLLPFNTVGLVPKRMQPSSRIAASVSMLKRAEFDRNTIRSSLRYRWKQSSRKVHELYLFDVAYSQLDIKDQAFINALTDIQQAAFTSEFISATSYNYTYNEQLDPISKNHRFLNATIELAGNTLNLLDNSTNLGNDAQNQVREIFDVPYYQYIRGQVDFRYYWNFDREHSWVNRVLSGYIHPYGNSSFELNGEQVRVPPFSRYYFMGGSNDLRAWPAYRLGAGTQSNTNYETGRDTSFSTGTFKFLINSEYRFPIFSSLKGALFVDAGNVWYTGGLQTEKTDLNAKALYNELAIGTGFGTRIDFDFFVIRFDVGMKLRDPALLRENAEWVLFSRNAWQPKNYSYHIALGYPF